MNRELLEVVRYTIWFFGFVILIISSIFLFWAYFLNEVTLLEFALMVTAAWSVYIVSNLLFERLSS